MAWDLIWMAEITAICHHLKGGPLWHYPDYKDVCANLKRTDPKGKQNREFIWCSEKNVDNHVPWLVLVWLSHAFLQNWNCEPFIESQTKVKCSRMTVLTVIAGEESLVSALEMCHLSPVQQEQPDQWDSSLLRKLMRWRSLQRLARTDTSVFHCEILNQGCGATGRNPSGLRIKPQQLADGGWREKSSLKRRGEPRRGWLGKGSGVKTTPGKQKHTADTAHPGQAGLLWAAQWSSCLWLQGDPASRWAEELLFHHFQEKSARPISLGFRHN